jgi:hypothetical protein
MPPLLVMLCACCVAVPEPPAGPGFVCQPCFEMEKDFRGPLQPYQPQAGDMFFSTDRMYIIRFGHALAGAHAPHHSGIIIQKPNGQYCTLEAGPHNCLTIKILDMCESLSGYEAKGNSVWVRRRSVPLTPEQSAKLTAFAMAQDGKRFALWRMLGQLTLLRSRGLLWTHAVGGPHGDRDSYFCAELVTECCGVAGLLDPNRIHPCCTYPSDLFYGKSPNHYVNETLDVNLFWDPPARWTRQPPGTGN